MKTLSHVKDVQGNVERGQFQPGSFFYRLTRLIVGYVLIAFIGLCRIFSPLGDPCSRFGIGGADELSAFPICHFAGRGR